MPLCGEPRTSSGSTGVDLGVLTESKIWDQMSLSAAEEEDDEGSMAEEEWADVDVVPTLGLSRGLEKE